jgi:hypothetical protein
MAASVDPIRVRTFIGGWWSHSDLACDQLGRLSLCVGVTSSLDTTCCRPALPGDLRCLPKIHNLMIRLWRTSVVLGHLKAEPVKGDARDHYRTRYAHFASGKLQRPVCPDRGVHAGLSFNNTVLLDEDIDRGPVTRCRNNSCALSRNASLCTGAEVVLNKVTKALIDLTRSPKLQDAEK